MEPTENFTDVSVVLVDVIRINKDVIKIYDNTNVDHVCEDVVHEMLKGRQALVRPNGITFHSNDP